MRPNLTNRQFKSQCPYKLWMTDITTARTKNGFVYTAIVTDTFTQHIVGWAKSKSMRTEALPLHAFNPVILSAKEKQVRYTIPTTACCKATMSTTNSFPGKESPLPPELSGTLTTVL